MMSGLTKKRISDLEIERSELQRQLDNRPFLRDQFAMVAMIGLISQGRSDYLDDFVPDAYLIADAMLVARNESTEN